MQLSFKKRTSPNGTQRGGQPQSLVDLREGQEGVLERIELPSDDAQRLMELGFLPGTAVRAARRSPFGDPRVYQVDGTEIAIRRETAKHLILRPGAARQRTDP